MTLLTDQKQTAQAPSPVTSPNPHEPARALGPPAKTTNQPINSPPLVRFVSHPQRPTKQIFPAPTSNSRTPISLPSKLHLTQLALGKKTALARNPRPLITIKETTGMVMIVGKWKWRRTKQNKANKTKHVQSVRITLRPSDRF